ncbi:type IV pilus modification protein PilV [Colwellia sp. KU-HH00111]|uniref:type IV pilus modification protein PilV n=1 Tax=Colwellia sp. KU-HH00111 TaxID=3127652 RepID=UPI0031031DF3
MSLNTLHKARKQKGMTFIEVLIALVIMVTGILGAVAMQATAKKGSFDAMQRSLASSLAQDIIERMRGNDSTALALYAASSPYGSGKIAASPVCNSGAALCTPANMVTHDLFGWEQALMGAGSQNSAGDKVGGLDGVVGCITVNGNAVTVVVTWTGKAKFKDAKKVDACGVSSNTRRQVVVDAYIL